MDSQKCIHTYTECLRERKREKEWKKKKKNASTALSNSKIRNTGLAQCDNSLTEVKHKSQDRNILIK